MTALHWGALLVGFVLGALLGPMVLGAIGFGKMAQ